MNVTRANIVSQTCKGSHRLMSDLQTAPWGLGLCWSNYQEMTQDFPFGKFPDVNSYALLLRVMLSSQHCWEISIIYVVCVHISIICHKTETAPYSFNPLISSVDNCHLRLRERAQQHSEVCKLLLHDSVVFYGILLLCSCTHQLDVMEHEYLF